MENVAKRLADICYQKGYVEHENIPWLLYNIERKLLTFAIGVPLFLLAILLSSFSISLSFFSSFYFIRSMANGYHSKSALTCFFLSALSVVVVLGPLNKYLPPVAILCCSVFSATLIFFFAPFDHINMNYSIDEKRACKISARIRTGIVIILGLIFYFLDWEQLFRGASLGLILTAALLCFAYLQRRITNEKESNNVPQ